MQSENKNVRHFLLNELTKLSFLIETFSKCENSKQSDKILSECYEYIDRISKAIQKF